VITAVDTTVLLDVFGADARFGLPSREALRQCRAEGALIACDIVWAEVAAAFPGEETAHYALEKLGVGFDALDESTAMSGGASWREYRQRGGTRTRVIPDFIIAAHATAKADRLLTRDRGFTRAYFGHLTVLDPTLATGG
jgi:predicted nucleic acid-binding protein